VKTWSGSEHVEAAREREYGKPSTMADDIKAWDAWLVAGIVVLILGLAGWLIGGPGT
jgi:hypothetical protein